MALEKSIEARIREWCKHRGILCEKFAPKSIGYPDRIIITPRGRVGFLEIKKPGGRLSAIQKRRIAELSKRGVPTAAVWSFDEAKLFIEFLLAE